MQNGWDKEDDEVEETKNSKYSRYFKSETRAPD